jgi:large subunit ribosomal protein L19
VVRRGRVRRAKLYYLRGLTGKKARITELAGAATAAEVSETELLEGAAETKAAAKAAAKV